MTAVPNSSYVFSKWQKYNGSTWVDILGATSNTYTFNVNEDIKIRSERYFLHGLSQIQNRGRMEEVFNFSCCNICFYFS